MQNFSQLQDEEERIKYASEALLSFKNGFTMKAAVKEEPMDEEFGPATMGLQRVGSMPSKIHQNQTTQPLNRRGTPARIRKKNKLFYDDDDYTAESENIVVPRSMLKTPRVKTGVKKLKKDKKETPDPPPPPIKTESVVGDRKLTQKIAFTFRNLLKLPKAQKWICYEMFYSNIDKTLFGGENDFTVCLKESFPQLKTYLLTRVEWCKMRRMMGKPRRCSQAFFEEERRELERKRSKIRQLQQRKPTDLNSCKDLPAEIPLQLVIGTKVTARLRSPQDGLFIGSVDAFDTSNNTYRITFERQGLGTHSIPDYEVLSNEPVETISVVSMIHALRPHRHSNAMGPDGYYNSYPMHDFKDEPALPEPPKDTLPTSVLENFVLFNKILEIKRNKVNILREMNTEAERKRSYSQDLTNDFVRKYASCIVELEHINSTLRQVLGTVQSQCQNFMPDMSMAAYLPSFLRNQSLEEAKEKVNVLKSESTDPALLDLVTELTALLIQIKSLSENDRNNYEVEVLSRSMDAIKRKLSPANKRVFESAVEVHLRHIQAGFNGEVGTFSMFMATRP
ncbi:DIRP [Nesidiocoris tenuis]|uniref:DIRP n=1 Tax=Nesidiocoris tenuis TaxID=355587 RepID=A0ABN7B6Z9_9HEMI|nr:DIRP [Nesidiocoris tenuis]